MGFFDIFRRAAPIRDAGELAEFIDANASFVAQKGIYEYSRARAGHYAKVLFREPEFIAAADAARWRAYPIGLVMVAELAEGVLCPDDAKRRPAQVDAIGELTLAVFDRYPVPPPLRLPVWSGLRAELEQRLKLIGLHPPKWAKDIPEPYWEAYFNLMPIYEKLKAPDAPTTRNYLRVTMVNVHIELTKRIDVVSVADSLQTHPKMLRAMVPPAAVNVN
jgi:hypothetical protein